MEEKTAEEMIKERKPSCQGDIELLMKEYATQQNKALQATLGRYKEALEEIVDVKYPHTYKCTGIASNALKQQ